MKMILTLLLLIFSLFSPAAIIYDTTYSKINHFNETDWKRITGNHSYPQPEKKIHTKRTYPQIGWLKYFLYAVVFALLVFLLYKLVTAIGKPSNKKIDSNIKVNVISEEEITFEDVNLDKNLSEAIQNADYRRAIRYSHLIAIRELSTSKLIVAAKDKTNYEYLRELNDHPLTLIFREITKTFEKSWYGEITPVREEYLTFENKFNLLRSGLTTGQK